MEKKLHRDENNKMIAGVCAGLADYLSVDVTFVRIAFVLALILHGCGLIPYIVLWIVMPKKQFGFFNFNNAGPVDYTVPPQTGGPIDYSVPNFNQAPFNPQFTQPKKRSNAGIVVGAALVLFGSFFLLDNFNLLPDWEFDHLWPLVFVAAGAMLIFSPRKKQPWEQQNWNAAKEEPVTEEKAEDKAGDKTEDTPPTV